MTVRSTLAAVAYALSVAIAAPTASHAQTPAELALRIDRLEAQLRELTGLIQQLTFTVEDLERLVEILRADNEALYQLLATAGIDPGQLVAETPAPAAVAPAGAGAANAPAIANPPVNLVPAPAPGGQLPGAPLDLTEALRPGANLNVNPVPADAAPPIEAAPPAVVAQQPAPPVAITATGDAQADYSRGYQLLLNGDYVLAEQAFTVFIDNYPNHPLAVDARFWMAESLFSRGDYSQAANQFYSVFVANQSHAKAPDMLLKLGLSFVQLGQPQSACDTFGLIPVRFPNASNVLLDRVATEQANAGC
jgi:tol-pal system protein YbgF